MFGPHYDKIQPMHAQHDDEAQQIAAPNSFDYAFRLQKFKEVR